MSLSKEEKKQIIDNLEKELHNNKFVILVDFKGLKAQDMYDLRNKLKSTNCSFKVAKRTLFTLAAKKENLIFEDKETELLHNTQPAVVFSKEGEIAPSKTIYQFSLQNKNIKILGGYLKNESLKFEFVPKESIIALAQLPSREQLLQNLVGTIASPLHQFVGVLQGNIKGLIISLNNIKNSQTV